MDINYSFIIPHKNIPHLLRRCLASIPRRDDIEIIVVDDASDSELVNNNTMRDIMEQPCVRVIYTKKNGGLSYVRNVGVSQARGKWFFIADADDFFLPDVLPKLDKYLESDADVVCFHVTSVYSDTQKPAKRGDTYNRCMDNVLYRVSSPNKMLSDVITTWTKLIKRNFFLENNLLFQETTRIWTDVYCGKMIAVHAKKIEVSPEVLYCVTERSDNMSNTYTDSTYIKQMYHVTYTTNKELERLGYCCFYHHGLFNVLFRARSNSWTLYLSLLLQSFSDGSLKRSLPFFSFKHVLLLFSYLFLWALPIKCKLNKNNPFV